MRPGWCRWSFGGTDCANVYRTKTSAATNGRARFLGLLVSPHHDVEGLGVGIDGSLQFLAQLAEARDSVTELTLVAKVRFLAP